MRSRTFDIEPGEIVLACMFVMVCIVVSSMLIGCVEQGGCPTPLYKKGDVVLVDDIYISTVIDREIVGCGDIKYDVETNVGIMKDVKEKRIKPAAEW